MPHVDDEVGAAGDECAVGGVAPRRDRAGEVARSCHPEFGLGIAHEAALRAESRALSSLACRRRATRASITRSGVTGNSSMSTPIALATALTSAGGKPASAPSLASLAPNGQSGSRLS